jgi:hypothetical protein
MAHDRTLRVGKVSKILAKDKVYPNFTP